MARSQEPGLPGDTFSLPVLRRLSRDTSESQGSPTVKGRRDVFANMVRTAINLYSVRELELPTVEILERVAAAGYDGVQFSSGFGDATADEVAGALDDLGLDVTAAHVSPDAMEEDTDGIVETYRTIGADGAVVPYLGTEHFETRTDAAATAERLDDLADAFASHEFDIHYHNHDHEFTDLGDATGMAVVADESSVLLEPDVGWIHTAGHDPVAFLERYGDRIDLVHMKDMADGEFREIGEGDVDMAACADAARAVDAEWLVYEHDDPDDPAASIDAGAAFLESL